MADAQAVRDMYNRKAADWGAKYARSGPLEQRLHLFEKSLRTAVSPPAEVLEIGCGTGNLAAHLARAGYRLTACDVAEQMIQHARQSFPDLAHWQVLPADWKTLPFETGHFSAVVASSVFEYVAHLEAVFSECARMLAPDGVFLLTVPNMNTAWRRAEAALRPLAPLARHLPVPRAQRFAEYLQLSHNRMSPERWNTLAAKFGLVPAGAPLESSEHLLLLRYKRPTF